MNRPLILGSTSVYRAELLARLRVPFTTARPDVDETPLTGEAPSALAARLALAKAQAVATANRSALVIGSDQVADLNGQPLGKPGGFERAVAQLTAMSGQLVVFHTAVALVCVDSGFCQQDTAVVGVRFRELTRDEIERYVRAEEPYDCAGSAKSEGLGVSLLASMDNDDPTALIGLPLIKTCNLLRAAGVMVP
jgi:septum formation protein